MSESNPYQYVTIVKPPKPEFLFTFYNTDNVLLARIRPNGEVEFGPGYTTNDELSRQVWQGLAQLPAQLERVKEERDKALSENAAWRKATGYSDPEALDFYLGRAGLPAHEKVWTEMLEKRAAEVERLRMALSLAEVEISLERSWCRACRTEGRGAYRGRVEHPHERRCPLYRATPLVTEGDK